LLTYKNTPFLNIHSCTIKFCLLSSYFFSKTVHQKLMKWMDTSLQKRYTG